MRFTKPICEKIVFDPCDVIATSGGGGSERPDSIPVIWLYNVGNVGMNYFNAQSKEEQLGGIGYFGDTYDYMAFSGNHSERENIRYWFASSSSPSEPTDAYVFNLTDGKDDYNEYLYILGWLNEHHNP